MGAGQAGRGRGGRPGAGRAGGHTAGRGHQQVAIAGGAGGGAGGRAGATGGVAGQTGPLALAPVHPWLALVGQSHNQSSRLYHATIKTIKGS